MNAIQIILYYDFYLVLVILLAPVLNTLIWLNRHIINQPFYTKKVYFTLVKSYVTTLLKMY